MNPIDSMRTPRIETKSPMARQQQHLFPWVKPYYDEPLVLSRGEGIWVEDDAGRRYLDFFAGILTTSIGHCHPEVTERVSTQLGRLGHTSSLYVTEGQLEAAEKLVGIAPAGLERVAFTNSGTEANETAIAAACIHTGRSEVVALRLSYSGRSALAANLTGHASWRGLPAMVGGIRHARSPYTFRSPLGSSAPLEKQVDFFIDDLVEVIETTTSRRPAALLVEPIQGVGGFIVAPPGYLARAAEVIRSYGGLFICDEVQTGFGRTGDRWFGCQHAGVEPDIMVMAKGIANGFPVGATMARGDVAESWQGPSISTYGGNPISMAAMSATLDVMAREEVPTRSAIRGRQLRAALDDLAERHGWIGEVRGMGLMQAIEIVKGRDDSRPDPVRTRRFLQAAKEEGILVGTGGLHGHVVRMGPSMLITEEEMAEAIRRIDAACLRAAE